MFVQVKQFAVHMRLVKDWHAGQTCKVSWVEDQGEGDEGSSRRVRVEGAPVNTDDLRGVWDTHTTNMHTIHRAGNHCMTNRKWLIWYLGKVRCSLKSTYIHLCVSYGATRNMSGEVFQNRKINIQHQDSGACFLTTCFAPLKSNLNQHWCPHVAPSKLAFFQDIRVFL